MGGEEVDAAVPRHALLGLPPRGRGRVTMPVLCYGTYGITPAWAGKSGSPISALGGMRDYPRVGGEEQDFKKDCDINEGLPPRGRGRDGYSW